MFTGICAPRAREGETNMKRIIALELSLLCIMISIPEGFSPTWMGIGMLVALFLTYVIFRIAIYQTE